MRVATEAENKDMDCPYRITPSMATVSGRAETIE